MSAISNNKQISLESQCFPNTRELFSSTSDSIIARVSGLVLAIILLPYSLMLDVAHHVFHASKVVIKLAEKDIKSENSILYKFYSASYSAKAKMFDIARTSKDFATKNKSTLIKVALVGIGVSVAAFYYPKVLNWLNNDSMPNPEASPINQIVSKVNDLEFPVVNQTEINITDPGYISGEKNTDHNWFKYMLGAFGIVFLLGLANATKEKCVRNKVPTAATGGILPQAAATPIAVLTEAAEALAQAAQITTTAADLTKADVIAPLTLAAHTTEGNQGGLVALALAAQSLTADAQALAQADALSQAARAAAQALNSPTTTQTSLSQAADALFQATQTALAAAQTVSAAAQTQAAPITAQAALVEVADALFQATQTAPGDARVAQLLSESDAEVAIALAAAQTTDVQITNGILKDLAQAAQTAAKTVSVDAQDALTALAQAAQTAATQIAPAER